MRVICFGCERTHGGSEFIDIVLAGHFPSSSNSAVHVPLIVPCSVLKGPLHAK